MDVATSTASTVIVDFLVKPIIKQARFLFCFNNIFKDLNGEEHQLKLAQQDMKKKVEIAERNAEEIMETVQNWLTNTSKILGEIQALKVEIEENKTCFNGSCPNWGCQYWLGRKAEKKRSIMRNLIKEMGEFQTVSNPAPLPGIEFSADKDFQLFKSTKLAFDQIIEALKSDEIHTVGLYGMGGTGKTALAKAAGNKAKKEIFDEVVMVAISEPPNFRDIQYKLADSLGLTFKKESEEGKAKQLYVRFMKAKKILVILDDVWESFNLQKEIGIPTRDDHKGCKVLLTTRCKQVCIAMNCQRKIQLNILNEEEGLVLLKRQANIGDGPPALKILASEVARECCGLPLALVAIGDALKEKPISDWKVMSQKLKKSKLEDIHAVSGEKGIYARLKLSYDNLKSETTKLCFLLCSLFLEDFEIPKEFLVRSMIGLDSFQDSDSIEDARNELLLIMNDLKSSCLLLDGDKEDSFKMHAIFRDVALWIASKNEHVFMSKIGMELTEWSNVEHWDQFTAISCLNNKIEELPMRLVCPKLKFLWLTAVHNKERLKVSDECFKEMKELKVVTLFRADLSLKSLQFLTNLRTLQLSQCNLRDISPLSKLNKLKILSFRGSSFKELPRELSELKKLRMFDLRECDHLERIPSNFFRNFSQLEELYIVNGFKDWEIEETSAERRNASLSELSSLSRLVILSLQINAKCLPKDFDSVCCKLRRYDISVNNTFHSKSRKNALTIEGIEATSLIAFKKLYQTLEEIYIKGCPNICSLFPIMLHQGICGLQKVEILCCDKLEEVSQLGKSFHSGEENLAFSCLEKLRLTELPLLKCIWNGPTHHINLKSLTDVEVTKCDELTYVFTLSLARSLVLLKSLIVSDCESLRHLVMTGDNNKGEFEASNHNIVLPKLKKLSLTRLANLIRLCDENYDLTWPPLESFTIDKCTNLSTSSTAKEQNVREKLRSLRVKNRNKLCDRAVSRLRDGLFKNFEELIIYGSGGKVIFQMEGLVTDGQQHVLSSSNLKTLKLEHMKELEGLCQGPTGHLSLENLTTLCMDHCNRLGTIFSPSLAQNLLQLQNLYISNCEELQEIIVEDDEECQTLLKNHPQPLFFQNLLRITVHRCPKLRFLFPITMPEVFKNYKQYLYL